MSHDPFSARTVIDTPLGERVIYRLDALRDIVAQLLLLPGENVHHKPLPCCRSSI